MSLLDMIQGKKYIELKKYCEDRVANILTDKIKEQKSSILKNLQEKFNFEKKDDSEDKDEKEDKDDEKDESEKDDSDKDDAEKDKEDKE